ncbi:MAG TPA: hypothetical protein VJP87_09960 [Candidatus Acidoferrales bacterium]|nr:hypothetical protein [Candidatus Acidoferrales bacterium]
MNRKELVTLASRATALYLIFWALDNLSYLPVEVFSLSHYSSQAALTGQPYLRTYYSIMVARHLILTAFFFVASIWIYRCGPVIESFLWPSDTAEPDAVPVSEFHAG